VISDALPPADVPILVNDYNTNPSYPFRYI
jgi:hypothetical protein